MMRRMDDKSRLGTGFAVAVAVHLVLAGIVGIFGYRFIKTPPQILEVTLDGGGGAAAPEEEVVEEQQEENTVLRSIDDIIDKKLKPEKKKVIYQKPKEHAKPNPNAGPPKHTAPGGTGDGSSEGTGQSTGGGRGSGQGSGGGNGDAAARARVSVPPRPSSPPAPQYPSSARASGAQGVTQVRLLINASGRVDDASIIGSSGNGAIDNAVLKAVLKWRFVPAKNGYGENVACYVNQAIRFNLKQ